MIQQNDFNDWLNIIIENDTPNKDVIAYWFGISETEDDYELYLNGSNEFDETDEDWACNYDFMITCEDLKLKASGANWEDVLNHVIALIKQYFNTEKFKDSFLDKSTAIACGFSGGDLIRLR